MERKRIRSCVETPHDALATLKAEPASSTACSSRDQERSGETWEKASSEERNKGLKLRQWGTDE